MKPEEVVLDYDEYIDTGPNDPREWNIARVKGPLIRNEQGENVRVRTGDVVDGKVYLLVGRWAAEVRKPKPVGLPTDVENDIKRMLGKAYPLFMNRNDLRQPLADLLETRSWKADLHPKWLQMVRKDKMRPYYALQSLVTSAPSTETAPKGKMSKEDMEKLGL